MGFFSLIHYLCPSKKPLGYYFATCEACGLESRMEPRSLCRSNQICRKEEVCAFLQIWFTQKILISLSFPRAKRNSSLSISPSKTPLFFPHFKIVLSFFVSLPHTPVVNPFRKVLWAADPAQTGGFPLPVLIFSSSPSLNDGWAVADPKTLK